MASLVLNETGMEDCGIDDSFKYNLYSVVYSVVFVLGLITNCAALFVFCFRMKMRNETTMFMTNLALSDLVFVFTLPFKVFYNVNRHWPFGDGLCKISGTAFITNIYGSMLFLTCISVDRFLAIVYPFRSRSIRTRQNAAMVCAAVWLTIVGGGISVTFFSTINQAKSSTTCFEGFSKSTWQNYLSKITIFIEVVGFLLPLIANLVCSSLVLQTLRQPAAAGHGCESKRRVLRMILVHLGIFIICFVPYNSILFLYALVRTQALANCSIERFARTLYPITLCLASLNCCLDPVVYYFTSESFQKSLTSGRKGSWTRPESVPRSTDTETQDATGTLSRDTTRADAIASSNGKETHLPETHKKVRTAIFMINLALADLAHMLSLPFRIYYYLTLRWPFGHTACLLCFYLKYLNMYASIYFLKVRTAIFMINLALADLAHMLSLPFRIYYYLTLRWPFGHTACLLCFYLKYLNMYASIYFLRAAVLFLLKPFFARRWRKCYDVLISMAVWLVVGMACLPFVLVRGGPDDSPASSSSSSSSFSSTQASTAATLSYGSHATGSSAEHGSIPPARGCFKDLPIRKLSQPMAITVMTLGELIGFLLPLAAIAYSSARIACSLLGTRDRAPGDPVPPRRRTLTSSSETDGSDAGTDAAADKRRALCMVLSCTALFLVCFAPYHVNFLLYMMVSQDMVYHCGLRLAVLQFHPLSLCMSGLSCCLNPLLYYFLTAEFRLHLRTRASSFASTLPSPRRWRLVSSAKHHRHRSTTTTKKTTKMIGSNQSCGSSPEDLQRYQHRVYAVVYAIIFGSGLLGNLLAIWVFWRYVKETKKAVVFMMNLAVADLMQVLSLPLRIYYYLNNLWPFGQTLCMLCFYLKYVNMYASIFFMACISVRRCELVMCPLRHHSSRKKGDLYICVAGWLLVFACCIPFPILRHLPHGQPGPSLHADVAELRSGRTEGVLATAPSTSGPPSDQVCFAELPMRPIGTPAVWALLVVAELLGFVLPLVLVLACAFLTAASLRRLTTAGAAAHDRREKRRALRTVLSCSLVFLVCFVPYHVTMPLDLLAKVGFLQGNCGLRELVLRTHPVTLCLASFNCSLDPLMYYFTTKEFWRTLGRTQERPNEALVLDRLRSCTGPAGDSEEDVDVG
ncbi:hypothetical protein CRUP_029042 [Coryphaenoides rupestris]|nr:hypothetical protein CRUP_029042 [Coryphaenoides rupestris]